MSQSRCSFEQCDNAGTEHYGEHWYCLGHYLVVVIIAGLNVEQTQRKLGPTEFKEKRDADA